MATDKMNQYLVTADMDGLIKVWDILEYATCHVDETIVELPRKYMDNFHFKDMISLTVSGLSFHKTKLLFQIQFCIEKFSLFESWCEMINMFCLKNLNLSSVVEPKYL